MSKQNTWTANTAKGHNAGRLDFGGGGNAKLELELLFDTSKDGGQDVRQETHKLWKMAMIHPDTRNQGSDRARPPFVQFEWGRINSFKGVIESINQKFILFNGDGTPIRAIVSLSLTQFEEDEWVPQNPTSAGSGGHKTRIVKEGDSLDLIAFEEYGDPNHWSFLAHANDIQDPLRLSVGRLLDIPPLVKVSK